MPLLKPSQAPCPMAYQIEKPSPPFPSSAAHVNTAHAEPRPRKSTDTPGKPDWGEARRKPVDVHLPTWSSGSPAALAFAAASPQRLESIGATCLKHACILTFLSDWPPTMQDGTKDVFRTYEITDSDWRARQLSNGWALCPAWFPKVSLAAQRVTYVAVRAPARP